MLSWLTKIQARSVARRVWIESLNCPQLSEELFRDHYEAASQATVDELTAFAFGLWQFWIDTNQSEPSVVCTSDEPMGFED